MRTSDRVGTAVVLLSVIATAAWSADPRAVRHPADWTDGERFAALTNDGEASRRVEAHRTTQRIDSEAEALRPYDIIDGAQNPHLYFPGELFDHVARYAFVDDPKFRAAYQEMREASRRKLGLPDDFWLQLESITAACRADQQEERALSIGDAVRRAGLTPAVDPDPRLQRSEARAGRRERRLRPRVRAIPLRDRGAFHDDDSPAEAGREVSRIRHGRVPVTRCWSVAPAGSAT